MGSQNSTDKHRSWRQIEALREKKLLRDNLADIWDDDWELDEAEVLGEDYGVKIYADSDEVEEEDEEIELDSDDDSDDFDDDEIFDDED